MDNWLLIIVATIFIICIVVGYVRGFLKLGISLLSTVLTLILVLFLSPYVANALEEYTPVDDYIESRIVEAFIPDITEEQLSQIDLSGTPFADLTNDQLANLNDLDWDLLGITTDDILNLIGEIPKDMQIQEIENAPMPQFLKDELIENNNSTIYGELGVNSFPRYVAAYISRLVLNLLSFPGDIPAGDHHCKSTDVCGEYYRGAAGARTGEPYRRCRARTGAGCRDRLARIPYHDAGIYDRSGNGML